jgi:hypothetical protein
MGVVCAYQMSKGELKDSNPAAFLILEHSMLQWTAKDARQDTPQSNKLTA